MKKLMMLILLFSSLFASFATLDNNVLSLSEAFKPSVALKGNAIKVDIELGDKIYLYKNKVKVKLLKPKNISLTDKIAFPKEIDYHEFKVYFNNLKFDIPLSLIRKQIGENVKKIKIELSFQGCSKLGLCYAPVRKSYDFDLPTMALEKKTENLSVSSTKKRVSKEGMIAETLANGSVLAILVTFFGFGLLLSLTPCIFPMIPILSSIIVSQSKESMSAKRGFFLSLIYVLSMSIAYTIAGVLAGLFGANIQIYMQNPWVIAIFSAIFVALAFSMFGYYELQLPSSFQAKVNKTSDKAQGKGLISVAIMGFLSALIVGPCVAAPLAGALIYIGQTGDALLGGAALFVMSLGMGMPLLLIGIGAGKYMPKPGGWMQNVSKVFGVVMLGVALYMLSRIIPAWMTMLLWSILFIVSAIYLNALEPLKDSISGIAKLPKAIGVIFLIYGITLFVGTLLGNTNPLDPLENFKNRAVYTEGLLSKNSIDEVKFKIVKDIEELTREVKSSDKPVLVDFSANWCVACKELEHQTFSDPKVKKAFKNFTLLRVDVSENSDNDKELMKKYKIFGPPVILFFDKDHNFLESEKITGFVESDKFVEHLKHILK